MDAAIVLRLVRQRAGLTLRQLAELAGTSAATLSAYETGRVTPRVDTLSRIVEAAGWWLGAELAAAPKRDPRRASAGVELWDVLELVDFLPSKRRDQLPSSPHAIFPS